MPIPPQVDPARCYPPGLPAGVQKQIDEGLRCPDEFWQTIRSIYYGMISNVDAAVGSLLDELEALGILDNTICIFTSDHGEHAGDHRLARKGALLFDSLIHVPLVLSGPGLPAESRINALVQEIDIFPTVLELLNLPIHAGVQGKSLLSQINQPRGPEQESIFCALDDLANPLVHNKVYSAAETVRTKEAKLIYFPTARTGMLYDLTSDPGETVNRFYDGSYASMRNDMMMLMLDRLYGTKDPLPLRLSQA
jgi:arylsulfatase